MPNPDLASSYDILPGNLSGLLYKKTQMAEPA